MGLILETVSDFYHLIILKLAIFILPIYCTLWIIGMACFSGLELWKMNLFCHYFINFSFTFLFIVTNIITMVTLLLVSLMLQVFFSFVMCCLSCFYSNYLSLLSLLLLPVCLLFVIVLQWFVVDCLGLS